MKKLHSVSVPIRENRTKIPLLKVYVAQSKLQIWINLAINKYKAYPWFWLTSIRLPSTMQALVILPIWVMKLFLSNEQKNWKISILFCFVLNSIKLAEALWKKRPACILFSNAKDIASLGKFQHTQTNRLVNTPKAKTK